jgi:hypothetical protein
MIMSTITTTSTKPATATTAGVSTVTSAHPAAEPAAGVDEVLAAVDRVLVEPRLRRYIEGVELHLVRATLTTQARQYAATGQVDTTGPDGSRYRPEDVELLRAHFSTAGLAPRTASAP